MQTTTTRLQRRNLAHNPNAGRFAANGDATPEPTAHPATSGDEVRVELNAPPEPTALQPKPAQKDEQHDEIWDDLLADKRFDNFFEQMLAEAEAEKKAGTLIDLDALANRSNKAR